MGNSSLSHARMRAMTTSLSLNLFPHRERAQRGGLLLVISALHVLAILWLATQSVDVVREDEAVISLIDIAAPPGGTTERAPPKPRESTAEAVSRLIIARSPLPATSAAPALASPSVSGGGGLMPGGCALAQAVGDTVLTDAAAMAELEALPPQARTQADAVMLWDGRWQSPGVVSSSTLPGAVTSGAAEGITNSALRNVVEQVIRDALTECREATVNGPQFIALPGPSRTTILVIGSGEWRWADLLRPDEPCPQAIGSPCLSPIANTTRSTRTPN